MKNNNSDPIYTFDPIVNISLYNDVVIPKSFHDYIWDMASRHIAKMKPSSDVDITFVLDDGTYDYLGKEGIIAAEKCLEHWAEMGYLPITQVDSPVGVEKRFTVD